jgi:RNA-directed DNA polymerase
MQESCSEGLAIHTDPESCGCVGNGISEALTGAHAGWVLSRESLDLSFGVPTLSKMTEGNTGCLVMARGIPDSARSKTPCTHGNSSYRNWDIPCLALAYDGGEVRTVNPKGVIQ